MARFARRMLSETHGENVTASSSFRLNDLLTTRVSAVDLVRSALRRAIIRGDLAGGSQLVQTDIASQLNVSTTPVREAMRDLATEGLITLDSHRIGTVRQLNWDDMTEIVEVRRSLEAVAVGHAISNITPKQLSLAKTLADELSDESDLGEWVEKNNRFHGIFHDATNTRRLSNILKSLEEAAGVFVAQAQRLHPEIRRQAVADHFALIEAYQAGDEAKALEIQYGHLSLPLASVNPDADPRSPEAGHASSRTGPRPG
jgi:DNA-binding GntR family transcriptional regulator